MKKEKKKKKMMTMMMMMMTMTSDALIPRPRPMVLPMRSRLGGMYMDCSASWSRASLTTTDSPPPTAALLRPVAEADVLLDDRPDGFVHGRISITSIYTATVTLTRYYVSTTHCNALSVGLSRPDSYIISQEAQLSHRGRSMLYVIEYFGKSLKITQGYSIWHP